MRSFKQQISHSEKNYFWTWKIDRVSYWTSVKGYLTGYGEPGKIRLTLAKQQLSI